MNSDVWDGIDAMTQNTKNPDAEFGMPDLCDRTDRVEVVLAVNELGGKPNERDFLTFGLEEIERLTHSRSGFLHFVNEDQETLELITWTSGALKHCSAIYDRHYPISQAGIWADCFRTRQPVVYNNYPNATGKKGLPEGHVAMARLVSVPIIESGKVRMILGVGNKDLDYTPYDVETLQLIGNDLWRIVHSVRIENELAASLERFHTIFNTIAEAIFLYEDEAGYMVDVNEAALQMFGYNREEFIQLSLGQLCSGDPPYTQGAADVLVRKTQQEGRQNFEWHSKRRNGELFWIDATLMHTTIGGRGYMLTVLTDITERKRTQQAIADHVRDLVALNTKLEDAHLQLLQSEKMASIGQLAAGVAHEINNPIGYVFSNLGSMEKYLGDFFALLDAYERSEPAMDEAARATVQRLRDELDIAFLREDVAALLRETREGIDRVRKIVQDLKEFSHVGSDNWQWVDVHAGLDSTLNIVWNELKYKTTVEKQYGDLPKIYCLPSQLNQVFMNLLVNAAHSIEARGTVCIRTGRQGDEIWVEVEDSGCGIPAENLKRIFDPFFTTKPVGKGTGLGLSVSYSIVQRHQGRIEVSSEVGKGSVFRVCLPIEPVIPQEAVGA